MVADDREFTESLKRLDRPVVIDPEAIVERVAARRIQQRTAHRRLSTAVALVLMVALGWVWIPRGGGGASIDGRNSWSVPLARIGPGRTEQRPVPVPSATWAQFEQLVRNQKLRRVLRNEAEQIRRDTQNQQFQLTREVLSRGDLLEDEFSMAFSF